MLRLIAEGHSTVKIAAALYISVRTVGNHVANLYWKLGVNSRLDAVLKGQQLGLVPLPEVKGCEHEWRTVCDHCGAVAA